MNAMDLDDIPWWSSKAEKDTYSVAKVFKIGHRPKITLDAFNFFLIWL